MQNLRSKIRDVPDFPKPGIRFKDITPLLSDRKAYKETIDAMAELARPRKIEQVVAIESRGFIFGSAVAYALGVGVSIVRKPKKLPHKTERVEYALEYGTDSLEMHIDGLGPHKDVVIVDDVLATGGTALATAELVEKMGGKVKLMVFLAEITALKGRAKLNGYPLEVLVSF